MLRTLSMLPVSLFVCWDKLHLMTWVYSGFGVDEFALPAGTNISQVHVLHRHGSRYPTTGAGVQKFGTALSGIVKNGSAKFSGDLAFVNQWSYGLGYVGISLAPRSRPTHEN